MGGRSHLRHTFQELDILGAAAKLEISQQTGERFAAEYAEFLFVDLLEHLALVELGDALEVAEDFLLGAIENLDLEVDAGLAIFEQVADAAPGGFHLLESGVVEDFVELQRQQVVDLRDALVDHRLEVGRDGHLAVKHLLDELGNQAAAPLAGGFIAADAAFQDDLVQKAGARGYRCGRRGGRFLRSFTLCHGALRPWVSFAPSRREPARAWRCCR